MYNFPYERFSMKNPETLRKLFESSSLCKVENRNYTSFQ